MAATPALLLALVTHAAGAVAADTPWSLDVGVAHVHEPLYAGSRRTIDDIVPVFGFTYGTRLKGSIDDGLRWTAFDLGRLKLGPVAEVRQANRIGRPNPFPGMRTAVEVGGFAEIDTPVAQLEARVRHAIDSYNGWSGDIAADTGAPIGRYLKVGAEARVAWAGDRFVRKQYGPGALGDLDPDGRRDPPRYLTAGGELDGSLHLTQRLDLSVSLARDWLISHIVSPANQRHRIDQIGTSISMHLGPAKAD